MAWTVWIVAASVLAGEVAAQDRRWLPVVEVAALADYEGTLFGYPTGLLASPRGGFILYDQAAESFREFSATLDPLWESGGRGAGPGEFLRPLDFEFDEDGNLLVVDEANLRLTVLDPDGKLVDTHRLVGARQILPEGFHPGFRAVMPNLNMDTLWVARDGPPRFQPMPPSVDYENSILGESWTANLKSGGAVVVFRWSGVMIWLNPDGSVRSVTEGVEPVAFPQPVLIDQEVPGVGRIWGSRVNPTAVPVTTGQPAANADRVYMRVLGSTENSGKIVDVYDVGSGGYLGSYLLPHAVRSVAILEDGRMATLEADFIPTVRLWSINRP